MNDLYSLCQLIKSHPLFNLQRDAILGLFYSLKIKAQLDPEGLLQALKFHQPDLYEAIQKNHALFKKHCEDSLKLKLSGVHLVCYGEELYPPSCYLMSDPPLTLSYRGSPAWFSEKALAVVGSREPCFESIQWMEKEFAPFCEKERPCVVSGGARGIDQKSHSVALRKSLPTIVVLPSGLENIYPESLKEWFHPILENGGCVLSEYAYEQKMHKHLFHHRNRLIAALGKATLLVEARKRSGTLITAHQSLNLGRPVWIVPGHPSDPHFSGSLELLMEGAQIVRDAQDLSMLITAEMNDVKMSPVGIVKQESLPHYR
ncbi:DNA-processing protein DprA [Bdellovibrio bacteriovorus]